ncbi:aminoacyl-histidine dipeptidase [Anaerostipes faecalis]|uniref:aminoacyl-histidine dipeptidase n=1 Tax=Anaerostipes faecalis TaxID=2738446 RepID=UPI003F0EEBBC
MDYKITGYEPEKLFHFFEEISAIPRGSENEKEISDYLVKFAQERGLWYHQDSFYNVIIKKEGSKGKENLPAVMLQGHIDMVCEKNSDVDHDFLKDGLDLMIKDGNLMAKGTTLGADNGVAVALMLMVMDDDNIVHPPLECVFTTQEEIGLNGAAFLDKSLIHARTMINMDSEEEGIATVSCAGGLRINCSKNVETESLEGILLQISIDHLTGGHSGSDIGKGRENANLLMARILYRLLKDTDGNIVSINGGNKDNAIPRKCDAVLIYTDYQEAEKAEKLALDMAEIITKEVIASEPDFSCKISLKKGKAAALSKKDGTDVVNAMYLAPNGVQKRNMTMDGFIETSSNMGIVATSKNSVIIVFSPRSSVASLMDNMKQKIILLADIFGFQCDFRGEYPGWSYVDKSPIREIFKESYKELFHEELKIEAIHAGLECGLFSDALPGLDAIAVGPAIYECHTPKECLLLDSFERFYKLLKEVLKRLTECL